MTAFSLNLPWAFVVTARAENRRKWQLSAPRAHTKAPYKTDLHRKTLRVLNRLGRPGQTTYAATPPVAVMATSTDPSLLAAEETAAVTVTAGSVRFFGGASRISLRECTVLLSLLSIVSTSACVAAGGNAPAPSHAIVCAPAARLSV
jgi:hypothetical protein